MEKKYYAIKTSMLFEKTVLVPVTEVKNLDEAIELVEAGVEISSINLLDEDADFTTEVSNFADENGIYTLSDERASLYQIIGKKEENAEPDGNCDTCKHYGNCNYCSYCDEGSEYVFCKEEK